MWVKPPAGQRVRDYRTGRLWPTDDATGETLPFEIPAGDPAFGQMLNHGALAECAAPAPPPATAPVVKPAKPAPASPPAGATGAAGDAGPAETA